MEHSVYAKLFFDAGKDQVLPQVRCDSSAVFDYKKAKVGVALL